LRSSDDQLADELAAKAAAGSSACFERLVTLMGPRLLRYLSVRTGDPHAAEDALQETLLRAYRGLDRYDPSRSVSAWLFAIASHQAVQYWRSRRQAVPLEAVASPASAGAGALDGMVADERRQGIWSAAASALSDEQYAALWMRYAEGLAVRDIAAALGRSEGSVKVMLHRACRRLMDSPSDAIEPPAGPNRTQEVQNEPR